MPSKPDRQTAVAERQHAPCCSWAVIISYLGTKPRQTSYYQYSTALRWSPKQLMPFEISGPTTMSTDFKQTVCGEGGIRTFSLYKNGGGRENLLMSKTSMNSKRARTYTQEVSVDHIFSTSNPYSSKEKLLSELIAFWKSRMLRNTSWGEQKKPWPVKGRSTSLLVFSFGLM